MLNRKIKVTPQGCYCYHTIVHCACKGTAAVVNFNICANAEPKREDEEELIISRVPRGERDKFNLSLSTLYDDK